MKNLGDLKDPAIAAKFDADGDGKADLAGCVPGWGCERVIEHQLTEYGLRDTVTHNQGEYNAIIADTIARHANGKPILYYTWTPYWVSGALVPGKDVEWLDGAAEDRDGKTRMALRAVELLADSRTLFIDGGTTNIAIAEMLGMQVADLRIPVAGSHRCLSREACGSPEPQSFGKTWRRHATRLHKDQYPVIRRKLCDHALIWINCRRFCQPLGSIMQKRWRKPEPSGAYFDQSDKILAMGR